MTPPYDSHPDESQTSQSGNKLSRLIEEYGFDTLGERVEEYWLREDSERYSLRELAAYVNHQILRTAMRNTGIDPLAGEVENIYQLLTTDDVSTGTRIQARRRLQRTGVDVDQLETDFVSRQAIHTYLTNDRGVSYSHDVSDRVEREDSNIRRLNRRMATMTRGKLEQLREADHITLGGFSLLVDMRVMCEDCGTQYQVSELLDARTCECSPDSA